jgi:hypothetical protein
MRAEPIDCFRHTRERAAEFSAMPYDVLRPLVPSFTHLRVHPRSFLAIDYPSFTISRRPPICNAPDV